MPASRGRAGGTGVCAWQGVGASPAARRARAWGREHRASERDGRSELAPCDLELEQAQGRHWRPLSRRFHSRTQQLARALSSKAEPRGWFGHRGRTGRAEQQQGVRGSSSGPESEGLRRTPGAAFSPVGPLDAETKPRPPATSTFLVNKKQLFRPQRAQHTLKLKRSLKFAHGRAARISSGDGPGGVHEGRWSSPGPRRAQV